MAELWFNGYVDDTKQGRAVDTMAKAAGFIGCRIGIPTHSYYLAPGRFDRKWSEHFMTHLAKGGYKVLSIQSFAVPTGSGWRTPPGYRSPAQEWRAVRPPIDMADEIAEAMEDKIRTELRAYTRAGGEESDYAIQIENELRFVTKRSTGDTYESNGRIDDHAHQLLERIVPKLRRAFPRMKFWAPSVWGSPISRLMLQYISHFASLEGRYSYPGLFDGWAFNHYTTVPKGIEPTAARIAQITEDETRLIHAQFDRYSAFGMNRKPRIITEYGGSVTELNIQDEPKELTRGRLLNRICEVRRRDSRSQSASIYTLLNDTRMDASDERRHGVITFGGEAYVTARELAKVGGTYWYAVPKGFTNAGGRWIEPRS